MIVWLKNAGRCLAKDWENLNRSALGASLKTLDSIRPYAAKARLSMTKSLHGLLTTPAENSTERHHKYRNPCSSNRSGYGN